MGPTYHSNPYVEFLNLESTRNSIHDYNSTVEEYLIPDWMKSIRYKLPPLLENYKVLIYNGQNEFLSANKLIWKVESTDQQVAGYVRQAQQFTQVIVRNAGHILPADQPRAALDMITRFI